MVATSISSEINLDEPGKQTGFLHLPHSVHRSAYGKILIPIVSINNGKGPTTLLIAGIHGDEYEGQIALGNLCRELEPKDIRGRLIILTAANLPAAMAGTRTSPIDQGNLNRSFPGDPTGTPTQMIAHYIEEVLIPQCDFVFDFHSGGSSLFYPATLLRGPGTTPAEKEILPKLQTAFDAPYAWVFSGGGGRKSTARTAMGAAGRKGAVTVMAELGGAGTVTPDILALTERGIKRLLHSIDMLPDYKPDTANSTRELQIKDSVIAYDVGVFVPNFDTGDEVCAGQAAGEIHFPETPWRDPVTVHFKCDGLVLCRRIPGRVEPGDCLFQVGGDVAPT